MCHTHSTQLLQKSWTRYFLEILYKNETFLKLTFLVVFVHGICVLKHKIAPEDRQKFHYSFSQNQQITENPKIILTCV